MIKATAQQLVEATLATLKEEGFAGATSRAIARRAGVNQALVFYHHGSVENLLVAALRATSEERLARYRAALEPVTRVDQLIEVGARLYDEDKASGHMTVAAQLIAGSVGRPELAPKVLELMEPWIAFAEETLERILPAGLPTRELAYAAVTFYTGVNLLVHLDREGTRTDALFARAAELAPLVGQLLQSTPPS